MTAHLWKESILTCRTNIGVSVCVAFSSALQSTASPPQRGHRRGVGPYLPGMPELSDNRTTHSRWEHFDFRARLSWTLPGYLLPRGVRSAEHSVAAAEERSVCRQSCGERAGSEHSISRGGRRERSSVGRCVSGVCRCGFTQTDLCLRQTVKGLHPGSVFRDVLLKLGPLPDL